ncbi:SsgA family sporulation/cell division regulator [Streptomyces cadmiisoli]|uniref:SsgA family sporulation/cell division regulator n=1 Tax=Streptomyces cadmiisoli TaxID=2184053 RepID=UPI0013A698C6|nr:SsgA family sporulation/cell division regulator [Streptomyces cadmiisoli]
MTSRTMVCLVGEDGYLRVGTRFRYDSADPYAVSVVFNVDTATPNKWEFARELLAAGRQELSGTGDVQIWPSEILGSTVVFISVRSGTEVEVVAACATVIDTFLERTHQLVPPGEEKQHLDIEDIVCRLLDQSA